VLFAQRRDVHERLKDLVVAVQKLGSQNHRR
jgi:hypothetical protein